MTKTALIFGIDGQDGSYLAELLLSKNVHVVGWIPDSFPVSLVNIQHLLSRVDLIDSSFFRPEEGHPLVADPSKASREIEWVPVVKFNDLVKIMVDADLEAKGLQSPGEGKAILERLHKNWHRWVDQVRIKS